MGFVSSSWSLCPKNYRSIVNDYSKHRIMLKQKWKMALFGLITLLAVCSSCSSVKPYQKMYLNDSSMALEANKLDFFETNFQTYREGASGANGGKVGGGCGCN
ncbi:MAG: hypothetical protein ACI81W_001626 [Saprospiraceae bacterium]|jgi:hypothetical protein